MSSFLSMHSCHFFGDAFLSRLLMFDVDVLD